MGNTGSSGSSIEAKRAIDPFVNEAFSSRRQFVRRFSQPVLSDSPRPSISSQGRRTSALTLSQRQIVKGCMDKARDDIAERMYRRIIEKRDDFRKFAEALSEEQRCELADALRDYLKNVANQLSDRAAVQRISEDFGARHVQYRCYGFRPDFFAVTADAITTECVLLDAAIHSASEALFAWSTLTAFMFSSVRDGYYNEQRRVRRESQQSLLNRSKILPSDASIDAVNQFNNERRRSSISSKYDADEMAKLEMSKDLAKRMEEEREFRPKDVTSVTVPERAEISNMEMESKYSLIHVEKKMIEMIVADKCMRSDVHKPLRVPFYTRHNSTV